ncbi:MAG: metalloregulator ArsR/SmtB family transcription factor [Chloroflexi bacterium]|nr:metalloregulator ArsR/SmtB family transcription factor [Chloroflexota bacterium]
MSNDHSDAPPRDIWQTLEVLRLLADETRWRILLALRRSDHLVSELVATTGLAQNLVSYHLGVLRQAGLVQLHRSDADGRATYYGIDLAALTALHRHIGAELALPGGHMAPEPPARTVVFLCRANSARSQIAEGWLRSLSGGRITVRSAGTQPARLHPLAEQVMREVGIDIGHHHAKHVDALASLAADAVVTVCDIAREECAVWRQAGTQLHWSIPDPAAIPEDAARLAAFRAVRDALRLRVAGLMVLLY